MVEMKYIVKHAFKYGEKIYVRGEEWIPAGSKFDQKIIRNLVRSEEVKELEVKHDKNTHKKQLA